MVAGLDALYGVVPVASTTLFTFKPAAGAAPIDLGGLVQGPDGAPYVLDRSTKTVYRIDLKRKKATLVARAGQQGRRRDRRDAAVPRRRRARTC